jgi:hypothetical protein
MSKELFAYFSFRSDLEFDKKSYHLSITIFYNDKEHRKEFLVTSNEFTGASKLLVSSKIRDSIDREWIDVNHDDTSEFIQSIGELIHRHNI